MPKDNDTPEQGVHRLLDMAVEEVSLVDHAANRRRFLVIKRNHTMPTGTDDATDLNTDDEDLEETPSDEEGAAPGGSPPPPPGTPAGTSAAPPHAGTAGTPPVAVHAPPAAHGLDGASIAKTLVDMADAMATLGEAVDGVCQRVAALDKAAPPPKGKRPPVARDDDEEEDDEEEEEDDESPPPPPRGKKPSPFARKLAKVRTALGVQPTTKRAEGMTELHGALDRIATDLGTIKTGLTSQQGRLARLEKQTGLPSSLPADGSSSQAKRAVSWPLDLNAPVDRDSVAKDVSFHGASTR